MKLIIITQKVDINDGNLGFFHRWLEKLSAKTDELRVVCLTRGEYHLPQNVKVYSLGKEKKYPKIWQFLRLQKFLLVNLPQVGGVFVHMCPIYAIASFPLVKLFKKRFIMFYAHGGTHFKLKIAEKMMDRILTSSPAGFRLKSKKVKAIGQGIDIDLFQPREGHGSENFRILYAGRINKTKDPLTIIKALDILVNKQGVRKIRLRIIGHPLVKSEREYLEGLKELVKSKRLDGYVEFIDGVPYAKMPEEYNEADLFINPSSTGSLDKVVLEAMASGCLILNCNEAYYKILADKYLFKKGDSDDLAQKIVNLMRLGKDYSLRDMVVKNHNLNNFIDRIVLEFK
ncbi:MAG: glycosyltransferase family 4 protein [Smithellaceae bacterium]|nr:glycosyltransferase family 4 protein [Smithellaceae bacterium]